MTALHSPNLHSANRAGARANQRRVSRLPHSRVERWVALLAFVLPIVTGWGTSVQAAPSLATYFFYKNDGITINDNTTASPYPSTIAVSGIADKIVTNVSVSLNGCSHTWPEDVDAYLVMPDGKVAVLLSDGGNGDNAVNLNLTFDARAATVIPIGTQLTSFRPFRQVRQ